MLSTELQEAAAEFGRVLRLAPVLVEYRASADALDADPAAKQVIAALQDENSALWRLQQAGLSPDDAQVASLRRCQAAVRADPTVMAYLRATSAAKEYLPAIGREVGASLGVDFAALVATGGC